MEANVFATYRGGNKKVKASVESAYLDGTAQEDNNVMQRAMMTFMARRRAVVAGHAMLATLCRHHRHAGVRRAHTMRVTIDLDLRVGSWHEVKPLQGSELDVVCLPDMLEM